MLQITEGPKAGDSAASFHGTAHWFTGSMSPGPHATLTETSDSRSRCLLLEGWRGDGLVSWDRGPGTSWGRWGEDREERRDQGGGLLSFARPILEDRTCLKQNTNGLGLSCSTSQ